MIHAFDTAIAAKIGLVEAILIQNIHFWTQFNAGNESKMHYHDGRYWTFCSTRALLNIYPYLKKHQIEKSLKNLAQAGWILIGNYNRERKDRTRWFTVSDYGISEIEKCISEIEKCKSQIEKCISEIETPIPYIDNTDIDFKNVCAPKPVAPAVDVSDFEKFYEAYPKKRDKKRALAAWNKIHFNGEITPQSIIDSVERHKQSNQWQRDDGEYIPYPATFLNGERWTDVIEVATKPWDV